MKRPQWVQLLFIGQHVQAYVPYAGGKRRWCPATLKEFTPQGYPIVQVGFIERHELRKKWLRLPPNDNTLALAV